MGCRIRTSDGSVIELGADVGRPVEDGGKLIFRDEYGSGSVVCIKRVDEIEELLFEDEDSSDGEPGKD